jgi:DNA replication licensing factor MCM2
VTKRSAVFPQLRLVRYECVKCGYKIGPFSQDSDREVTVNKCANCQGKGPFKLDAEEVKFLLI